MTFPFGLTQSSHFKTVKFFRYSVYINYTSRDFLIYYILISHDHDSSGAAILPILACRYKACAE